MSLIKVNRRRFPWLGDDVSGWLNTNDWFSDEESLPAMNVKETDNNFEIELAVPGFSKKDIEVSMENDMLHVSAHKSKEEVEENDKGYTRKEFSYNEFDRKLKLPTTVNPEKEVKATYKDGILSLRLAKSAAAKEPPKKVIEIA